MLRDRFDLGLHLVYHPEDYETFKIGHQHWITYKTLLLWLTHILYGNTTTIIQEKAILCRIVNLAWFTALNERISMVIEEYHWQINTHLECNRLYGDEVIYDKPNFITIPYKDEPLSISPYFFVDEWIKEKRIPLYQKKVRWTKWRIWILDFFSVEFLVISFYLVDWLILNFALFDRFIGVYSFLDTKFNNSFLDALYFTSYILVKVALNPFRCIDALMSYMTFYDIKIPCFFYYLFLKPMQLNVSLLNTTACNIFPDVPYDQIFLGILDNLIHSLFMLLGLK